MRQNHYYHVALADEVPQARQLLDQLTVQNGGLLPQFNVIKLSSLGLRTSLLLYHEFESADFPELTQSTSYSFAHGTARTRRYGQKNPPVLHRKELLLPLHHQAVPSASNLTAELERRGAFQDSKRSIGTRESWGAHLRNKGISVSNGIVRLL